MNFKMRSGTLVSLLLLFPVLVAFAAGGVSRTNSLAIAGIDPRGPREGGDALNWQPDMRARLFRERNPEAFHILTDTNPPVLAKVPIDHTSQEAGRIMARALTLGEEEFRLANGGGKREEAIT